jgi:hypothetical protein
MKRDPFNNNSSKLQELAGSGYEIQDGQPDIKGWKVQDASSRGFGEVIELLFHPPSQKVRYLVLDLAKNEFDLNPNRVIIPIGLANLKVNEKRVLLREVNAAHLEKLPEYERGHVDTSMETAVRNIFNAEAGTDYITDKDHHDPSFYEHRHYDEEEFYGKWKTNLESGGIKHENSSDGTPNSPR